MVNKMNNENKIENLIDELIQLNDDEIKQIKLENERKEQKIAIMTHPLVASLMKIITMR